jgi:hypothetical protein
MERQMKIGGEVNVYEFGTHPDRRLLGRGVIYDIEPFLKGYDGPVARVRIPGETGLFLRATNELTEG